MKTGYFMTAEMIDESKPDTSSGITKKILAQAKALDALVGCELVIMKHRERKLPRGIRGVWIRLPYTGISNCWFYEERFKHAKFICIRREFIDQSFIRFLKKIKRISPETKLLLELPNYPYNQGKGRYGKFGYPFYLKNEFGVSKLNKFVDRIITYSSHKEIFGIKTINVTNGIDFELIRERDYRCIPQDGAIHMIGVAQIREWHGYDRIVEGLHVYYQKGGKRDIVIHIVGDAITKYNFEQKIQEYGLEKRVIMHGKKFGKELDEIYDICTLALESFGGYRIGAKDSKSLKSREYTAKGLPIVTCLNLDIEDDYEYVKHVKNDESPLDFEEILTYYDKIYKNNDVREVAKQIRQYGEKNFDWKTVIIPVVNYINGIN